MSAVSRLRRAVSYEIDVPRCANCKHFRPSVMFLRNSLPVKSWAECHLHEFTARPTACCNSWQGKRGDVLKEE